MLGTHADSQRRLTALGSTRCRPLQLRLPRRMQCTRNALHTMHFMSAMMQFPTVEADCRAEARPSGTRDISCSRLSAKSTHPAPTKPQDHKTRNPTTANPMYGEVAAKGTAHAAGCGITPTGAGGKRRCEQINPELANSHGQPQAEITATHLGQPIFHTSLSLSFFFFLFLFLFFL